MEKITDIFFRPKCNYNVAFIKQNVSGIYSSYHSIQIRMLRKSNAGFCVFLVLNDLFEIRVRFSESRYDQTVLTPSPPPKRS